MTQTDSLSWKIAERFVDEQLAKLKAHWLSAVDPQAIRAEAREALITLAEKSSELTEREKKVEAAIQALKDIRDARSCDCDGGYCVTCIAEAALSGLGREVSNG